MKKKIHTMLLLLITLLTHSALAAEWKQIDEKEYIDVSSIQIYNSGDTYSKKRYNRNEKEFWIKSLNDKSSYFNDFEKNYNKKVWYTMSNNIIDCNNKTIATKSFLIYDTSGNIIDSNDIEYDSLLKRNKVIPETKGEYWCNIVCTYLDKQKVEFDFINNSNNDFDKMEFILTPAFYNLYNEIKEQWNPKVYNKSLECKISFTISKEKLSNIKIYKSSGNPKYDNEAIKIIKNAKYPKSLPEKFKEQNIEMLFTFIN